MNTDDTDQKTGNAKDAKLRQEEQQDEQKETIRFTERLFSSVSSVKSVDPFVYSVDPFFQSFVGRAEEFPADDGVIQRSDDGGGDRRPTEERNGPRYECRAHALDIHRQQAGHHQR